VAKISTLQLANYVVDELEKGVSSAEIAQKIAGVLLDTRQSRDLSKIIRAVEAELNSRGIDQVSITSAHEVSSEVKKQLATLLGAKNPVFNETIDPSVVGSVKAHSGELELDLTVLDRLNRFKSQIAREV